MDEDNLVAHLLADVFKDLRLFCNEAVLKLILKL